MGDRWGDRCNGKVQGETLHARAGTRSGLALHNRGQGGRRIGVPSTVQAGQGVGVGVGVGVSVVWCGLRCCGAAQRGAARLIRYPGLGAVEPSPEYQDAHPGIGREGRDAKKKKPT